MSREGLDCLDKNWSTQPVNNSQVQFTVAKHPPPLSRGVYSRVSADDVKTDLGWLTPHLERWCWPACGALCKAVTGYNKYLTRQLCHIRRRETHYNESLFCVYGKAAGLDTIHNSEWVALFYQRATNLFNAYFHKIAILTVIIHMLYYQASLKGQEASYQTGITC